MKFNHLQVLKTRQRAMSATGAAIASMVCSAILGAPGGWLALLLSGVAGGAFYLTLDGILNLNDACYRKRIETKDPEPWDVHVNGAKVGAITDAEYATIQRRAFRDYRNAVGQFFNVGKVALALLGKVIVAVPLVVFWGAAALAVSAPDLYGETIQALKAASAAEIAASTGTLLHTVFFAVALIIGASVLLGGNLGFTNFYSAAVGRMVRQHCKTPAEGHIVLSRMVTTAVPPTNGRGPRGNSSPAKNCQLPHEWK